MAPFDSSFLLAEEPAPLADLLPEASSPPTTKPSSSSSRVPAPRHPLLAAASPPDSRAGPAPKESSSSSLRTVSGDLVAGKPRRRTYQAGSRRPALLFLAISFSPFL